MLLTSSYKYLFDLTKVCPTAFRSIITIFAWGRGPARLPENNSDNVFSPQLILQFYSGVYQWFISKLSFSKVSEGVRGVQHFYGVPNANVYRNP